MKTSTIVLLASISLCISLTSCDRRSSIAQNKKEAIKKELSSTREALNLCDDYRRDSLVARVMVLETEYFATIK